MELADFRLYFAAGSREMAGRKRRVIGMAVVPLLVVACGESDGVRFGGPGDEQALLTPGVHTPHTGPSDGIWPPQPEGMTGAEPFPASARAGVLSGVLAAARKSILNNPQVRSGLGTDYREIEATLSDDKSDQVAGIVFYNYTTDETIEASLAADGTVSSRVSGASVYQPMEHPQEQTDAIVLAQTALTNSSFDITGLQATAMLAFPPLSDIESNEAHFYQHRVLYVTFGPGAGELPVYTALVDLSNASVIEHGPVK